MIIFSDLPLEISIEIHKFAEGQLKRAHRNKYIKILKELRLRTFHPMFEIKNNYMKPTGYEGTRYHRIGKNWVFERVYYNGPMPKPITERYGLPIGKYVMWAIHRDKPGTYLTFVDNTINTPIITKFDPNI